MLSEFTGFHPMQKLDFWNRLTAQIRTRLSADDTALSFETYGLPELFTLFNQLYVTEDEPDDTDCSEDDWDTDDDEARKRLLLEWEQELAEMKLDLARLITMQIAPAAEKGCAFAQQLLGEYYTGVYNYYAEKNEEAALNWSRKAARQGLSHQLTFAAWKQANNHHYSEALSLYKEAAECGDLQAKSELAVRYLNGAGIARDTQRAAEFAQDILKCDLRGNSTALWVLGKIREESAYPPDTEAAFELYRDAGMRWDAIPEAMFDLARCYENGIGIERDEKEAFHWYEAAAQKDSPIEEHPKIQYAVGRCYENGIGISVDTKKAVEYFKRAAFAAFYKESNKAEDAAAMDALARCYENGIGIEQDEMQALHWREEAEAQRKQRQHDSAMVSKEMRAVREVTV